LKIAFSAPIKVRLVISICFKESYRWRAGRAGGAGGAGGVICSRHLGISYKHESLLDFQLAQMNPSIPPRLVIEYQRLVIEYQAEVD
jgi:hypothetical protein